MAYLEDAGNRNTTESKGIRIGKHSAQPGSFQSRWIAVWIFILVLGIWEWLVRAGVMSALFFPAPSVVARKLGQWIGNGHIIPHLAATLSRVWIGFAVGGGCGLLLGIVMGWSRRIREVTNPFISAAHPIPKISILPLIMIVFGIGETSKVVVVAIAAFFPMVINTTAGISQIDHRYFEVVKNYGATTLKTIRRVVIPGSLPFILTGSRLALNTSLVISIAIELVSAQEGLGALIWLSWETLRTEELYASLAVTALLGIGINSLLSLLMKLIVPWQQSQFHV